MTHADKVREAKERVVETAREAVNAAVASWRWYIPTELAQAVTHYEALVAQTCATCKGEGTPFCLCQPVSLCNCKPCHAKCDNGRKVASDG